jgi:hypothetical protein
MAGLPNKFHNRYVRALVLQKFKEVKEEAIISKNLKIRF